MFAGPGAKRPRRCARARGKTGAGSETAPQKPVEAECRGQHARPVSAAMRRSCRLAGDRYRLRFRWLRHQAPESPHLTSCRRASARVPALRASSSSKEPNIEFAEHRNSKVRRRWRAKRLYWMRKMKVERSTPEGQHVYLCGRPCRRVSEVFIVSHRNCG